MKTISSTYTVATLAALPATREVLLRHLRVTGVSEIELLRLQGTLREMYDMNMGGGIPHDIIAPLMDELDSLEEIDIQMLPSKQDAMALANLIYDIYKEKKEGSTK